MRGILMLLAATCVIGCGGQVAAGSSTAVLGSVVAPPAAARMIVHSDSIGRDGQIAIRNTAFGAGLSPELSWTPIRGTRAYAVVLEDPDAHGPRPFVHWLLWNIPPQISRLAEGAAAPAGSSEGRNGTGRIGYAGPHPPSGTHHYYLQVFALDQRLGLSPGADRDALEAALRGHVLAFGQIVGVSSPPGR